MKKLLSFLMMFTLFFGVGWAATITFSELGLTNGTQYTDPFDGGDFTVTFSGGTNDGKYYNTGTGIRLYSSSSGKMTIESKSSNNITNIKLTCASGYYPSSSDCTDVGAYSALSNEWTGNAKKVIFTNNKDSQWRIQKIEVTISSGGTPQPTTYSLTLPSGLTGGTVTATGASDLTAIPSGTNMTVTATPSTGYALNWMKANGVDVENPFTFAITENTTITASFQEQSTPSADEYELVTNVSQLSAGDQIIIASTATAGPGYAMSTEQKTNNRGATDVTIANSKINPSSSVQILTLEKEGDNWLFNTGSGYLYAASSAKNWLRTETTADANAEATISISSNAATVTFQGTNTRNELRYNVNTGNGDPLFSCYASSSTTGTSVYIYKKVEATPQANDVYIIGQVNGHDSQNWNTSEGVQMSYSSNNDNYTIDIYCTGVNTGNDEGYSHFLFAKSLPFSWDVTSNLYGSGADDGGYWGIGGSGESAFGEEIPLYEGSKKSFRLAAGLYTVTVDLDYTGHQYTTKSVKVTKRDVTMTISPTSGYFSETQTVTMASNLTEIGGKIYYTTNGNDPRDQYSGRQEYTDQLTISETTTFKAVAYVGNLYSDVVEKTYTKTPAAPVITPASCTFSEPFQVTITAAESGATIYYTTDGSNPTDQSTQYTGPFTVSATTTVKAKAYVDGVYGATATETYTYSNVQPGTDDFVLVTSADQLVADNEYIILNASGTYALGELTNAGSPSNLKGIGTQDFTLDNTTVSAGSGVTIFTLEESDSKWKFKISDNSYLTAPTSTNLSTGSNGTSFDVSIDNNVATISSTSGRLIGYNSYEGSGAYSGTTFNIFGNYASNNFGTGNYQYVYLYTRESNTVLTTTTLAALEDNPVKDKKYAISDELTVLYVADDGTAYAKDNNGADEQTATDGQIDYLAEKLNTVNTDHSNWIAITGLTDGNLTEGSRLTNVVGTLSDAVNFTLAAQSATVDNTYINEPVVINQYVPCNFGASTQIIGDKTYFFAHPQIMEYAYIFAAVWKGNDTFEVPENNAAGLTGSFTADLNGHGEGLVQGTTVYEFHAIVKKAAAGGNGAPRRIAGNGGDYEVMLTEDPKNPDVQTAVTDVRNAGEVAGVKYVNVAGQVSSTPWQGVNIVVTRMSDGTTRTAKVVK